MPRLPRSTTEAVALATLLAVATHAHPASAQRQLTVPLTLRRGSPPRALEGGAAALPLDGAIRDAGYYTATLAIGTPPLAFDVIVDTGSTMTYVPCAGCGRSCGPHHQAGFSVDGSSTARAVRCGAPDCACGTKACGCAESTDSCTFSREYAEQSSVGGLVVSDVVSLPPEVGAKAGAPPHSPARITLGCTTKETGEIYAQRAAGVAGLGNATTGLVTQLAAAGAIGRPAFALCLAPDPDPGSANHNGVLVLGGGGIKSASGALRGDPVRTTLAPAANHPAFYAVAVASMALVGAGEDGGSAATTELGSGAMWAPGTVLDSGSTFTFLPPAAATALRGAAAAAADDAGFDRVSPPGTGYGDPCWDVVQEGNRTAAAVDAAVAAAFPSWRIAFTDGASITLPATHYIVPHASRPGAACVAVYASPEGRGGIIGAASLRGLLVEVDAATVTLARADCGALGGAAAVAAAGIAAPRPATSHGWANAAAVPHQRVAVGVALVAAAAAVGSAAAVLIRRRRRLRNHDKLSGSQIDMVGHGQRSDVVELGRV